MLERIEEAPAGVDAVRAVGTVTKRDYETVIEPLLDKAREEGSRIRFLYEFGSDFKSFTPSAGWEDFKVGIGSVRLLEGCAIVSDIGWIRESSRLMGFLMSCPVRVFGGGEREEALRWLVSLPEGPGVSHRLVAETGVLVVELDQPLRAQDFEALTLTVDNWLATHEELVGIVVHAKEFPGWENVDGLLRHLRFVRDHHRKVKRIALAADSRLASLAPRLANHFVRAEVRPFDYDGLDEALAWAGRPMGATSDASGE
ncbi:STAS/SEC14 domain-containing protein [Streptomyces sp. NPDC006879]|uniref:STAS/SEC14 domain-containing protein n=1 Tax=Streptomyces sp. NPDC006879 TaxID=3364767 RepID=UPI00368722C4